MPDATPFYMDDWFAAPRTDAGEFEDRIELECYKGSPDVVLACTQLPGKASRQTRIVKEWGEFFAHPNPVRRLVLASRVSVKLFEAVCQSAELEALFIKWGPIKDLAPLAGLKKLSQLHLGSCSVESLKPLAELPQLRELSLESIDRLSDYSPIGRLACLEFLMIEGSPWSSNKKVPVNDLSFVSNLPSLRGLCIGYCKMLTPDWHEPLLECHQLEQLYLPQLNEQQRNELLAALPNLRQHNLAE